MKKIWFRRKYFGWGWQPVTWQGWLITIIYIFLLILFALKLDSRAHSVSDSLISFALPFIVLTTIIIIICYKTGEKPRWQWWGKPINKKEE